MSTLENRMSVLEQQVKDLFERLDQQNNAFVNYTLSGWWASFKQPSDRVKTYPKFILDELFL